METAVYFYTLYHDVLSEAKEQYFLLSHEKKYTLEVRQNGKIRIKSVFIIQINSEIELSILTARFFLCVNTYLI